MCLNASIVCDMALGKKLNVKTTHGSEIGLSLFHKLPVFSQAFMFSTICNVDVQRVTHSLTTALDQLRVVAISTMSGPGSRIGRH